MMDCCVHLVYEDLRGSLPTGHPSWSGISRFRDEGHFVTQMLTANSESSAAADPRIHLRNVKATQKVLGKPQISQVSCASPKKLILKVGH